MMRQSSPHDLFPNLRQASARGHSKHARQNMPAVSKDGLIVVVPCGIWHTTKRRPWTVRAERRAANRRARAARKANR